MVLWLLCAGDCAPAQWLSDVVWRADSSDDSVVCLNGESHEEAIMSILIDGRIPRQNFIRKRPSEKVATIVINPPIEVLLDLSLILYPGKTVWPGLA